MKYQSQNSYIDAGTESKVFVYCSYPMIKTDCEIQDLQLILTSIGGYWSAISGVGFLLLNYFLYLEFINSQAKNIFNARGTNFN